MSEGERPATVEEIDERIARERFKDAREGIEEALAAAEGAGPQRFRLGLRRARLLMRDPGTPVDEVIFLLDDLLDAVPVAPEMEGEAAHAHATRIRCYALKRSAELTAEAVEAARRSVGEDPRVLCAEGSAALAFDDRPAARAAYERAIGVAPDAPLPRYAMADLRYVLGDFDGCLVELDRVIDRASPTWGQAMRLRATVHATREDHRTEASVWRTLLAGRADGDFAQQDRLALSLALAGAGERGEALDELRAAWRHDPHGDTGRYARKRIEYLERVDEKTATRRLPAFPTTSQKWNYCGPAVLELCLRYLDLELTQDEIAEAVKRERGTPMYEIVSYLRNHDIAARRIEATPARLKAAIDLGLAVIVQEEYSTTSHVAVVTGYDEALGLFIAADPATHRPLLKSFEWTERAGALFGNGGVIVLGRRGSEGLVALEARADEAGLVEARHLVLLDDCDRRRPRAAAPEAEDAALEEVVRLCHQAIELAPRFKLAWHRRLDALHHLFRLRGGPQARSRVLADLHHVRTSFAEDEWTHQLHAHWLFDEGRFHEAFVAYLEASLRDPDDANNLQSMGECRWLAGDLAAAEQHLLGAIAKEPFHPRAAENLAAVYLRQLQHLDADGGGATMTPETIDGGRVIARGEDDLARRAWHMNRVARALGPQNPFNHEVAGDLLARRGDWAGAVDAYRKSRAISPERTWGLFGLARALEQTGAFDEAQPLLEEGVQRHYWHRRSWQSLGAFLERRGELAAAAEVLRRGIETLEQGAAALVDPLFDALRRIESAESAAGKLRELAERRAFDADLLREVAWVLDSNHQRGHSVALLRHVVALAPGDVNALYRLGNLLAEDLLTREEGIAMLGRVVELAPDAPPPRRQLAWHLVPTDPERGLALLAPILDSEDPYAFDAQAALLEALGRKVEAESAMQLALDAHGSPAVGLIELARFHLDANRYDRAVSLARRIFDHPVPKELTRHAESIWLASFRLSGNIREALPRLRDIIAESESVPAHLAFEVYWGCRSIDHRIAYQGAMAYADKEEEPAPKLEWRIHAAKELCEMQDESLLAAVRQEAGESAAAWAHLAYAYEGLHRFGEANDAARKAYAIDPTDREALSAMQEAHVRLGELEASIACARRLIELYPYEHQGPERLGALLAKSFQLEEALAQSHRAVDAAPFCHNAHWSRAVAFFAAGDHAGAELHARRSLAIEEPDEPDPASDCVMIVRALERDAAGVKRCLGRLAESQPASIFAEFKQRLLDVAGRA